MITQLQPWASHVGGKQSCEGRVSTQREGQGRLKTPQDASTGAAAHEADLVTLVGRGDARAYRVLLERHLTVIVAQARRALNDASEAEDVAQETFLRLWRAAPTLVIDGHGIRPWLRRVATNLSIDRMRSGRRMVVTDQVPETLTAAQQPLALAEQELHVRMEAALSTLPERQRQALKLFHFDGCSQGDVAAQMDISEEAVESLLARARRTLKVELASDWRELMPDSDV